MKKHPIKPELLAPAGSFEKLEIAIHYGADAVYLAGKNFSLRNFSGNFTDTELVEAVRLAHHHGVKVYLACNIYSRNHDQEALKTFLEQTARMGPDAIILSDPGILYLARQMIPDIDIHLSTQANTTNVNAVRFWHSQGVKRVNLARELSLTEITDIATRCAMETETFVHGAMCISYSGRCLLSSALSGRDSNRGLCSHPCRWQYAVVENLRPNEYHSLMEDDRGSYIFNSKDLCMIEHIPELIDANITSLKIEGRMKGINYLASVVKTYRNAIDDYIEAPDTYVTDPEWVAELYQVFHREYSTGFYFGPSDEQLPNYNNIHHGKIHSFIGKIISRTDDHAYRVGIRNKLCVGDTIEVLSPLGHPARTKINALLDMDHTPIPCAQPNTMVLIKLDINCRPHDIIRKI
ncbi:U32 family peptidase [Desulfobacula sp.]|uniref:peptidase U32 family protein n=1 Tax=Desulfobacula sp. TaxID=2593537 RepID=UPI00261FA4AD|nr:U32 family peptidase [Desulfobacula sp.]